mmetsp:Transcript_141661/g.249918  ORF Transcript_141661/g.249918 Transcript_141661/m.249918 type:complete len:344 (+) Transcript_141661:39-1070(+)
MAEVAEPPGIKGLLHMTVCVIWAALIGMSVPFGMVINIMLNSEADESDQKYHAFYVSNLAILMGGLELLPLTLCAEKPVTKPKRWWHLAGGVTSLPSFFTTSAGALLGSQVVLVVQLAGLLTTFYLCDLMDEKVRLKDYAKSLALLVIFVGVFLDADGTGGSMVDSFAAIAMIFLVAVTGVGFALSSKCNSALADDLGSAPRASVISACVNTLFSVPINLYIYFGCNIAFSIDTRSWYWWLATGFQSAFYTGSMAYLPKTLGFTRCYVITLAAKMVTSLFIDAYGLTGESISVSFKRVCALMFVSVGAIWFNVSNKDAAKSGNYAVVDQESTQEFPDDVASGA